MRRALSDLPVSKVIAVLESVGFVHTRTSGSHAVFRHTDGRPSTSGLAACLGGSTTVTSCARISCGLH
ncbi:MAG: type II toxin-antitoxin system HicA family toxin [Pseudonocardiales bacterium]|nr:type II toxin-antitoxin system HicA family toxin [Pseudonocardiales bacterium]